MTGREHLTTASLTRKSGKEGEGDGRAIRFLGSARRDYSLFVNIYFIFTNMSNTGDKEKETPVNTNGGVF
uniref:Uncharacterized protein n=1 Tax=Oryza sativa subsp. japonica TaxID=39947 RepID=Q6AT87_ORYSJ|nr:hypothetical protein [Oryza sativa Japonica Group]AAU10771.1 hypothetical protein [Oryza sativa Japonica Group]